ncbi:MAG: RDD family protein [Gaiellales bacterium]
MLDDRIEISTPERVTVADELAGVGSRLLAQVIDVLVVGAVVTGILIVAGTINGPFALAIAVGGVTLTPVAYFLVLEWLRHGSTPGKAALHLRVLRATGEPIGLSDSAVRNIVRIADFLPFAYIAGGLCAIVSKDGRRLGDMAANTVVVRTDDERTTGGFAGSFAALAADAEREPVPPELMAVAIAFRRRLRQIDKAPRDELAARIAARIEPYRPRPEGMGEEEYVIRAATRTLPGRSHA